MKSTQLLLSAVVITKNETQNIQRCLLGLQFCDEIILIDDNSTDQTVEISRKYGAHPYVRSMKGDFAAQRNFGLKKARGEWVLFIDADEIVSVELANEILFNVLYDHGNSGYYLRRRDILWGKRLSFGELSSFGSFGNAYILRLGKRRNHKWIRRVHELWNVHGKLSRLNHDLLHYPHPTFHEFLADVGERAQIHAQSLAAEKKKSSLLKAVVWPIGKFLYNYICRLGFLDGDRGFILAVTMSFHSFLSWSYLCTNQKQKN